MYRLGYDIGGTFTDLILVDDDSGAAHTLKVPSTPAAPADGALDGLLRLTRVAGVEPAAVRYLAHGSTVALNAILEGKTARVGLITTAGFRDVLEIGRLTRVPESGNPEAALYDTQYDKPQPLVPRYLRLGVAERIDAAGRVLTPLTEASVAAAVAALRERRVEVVAVCFLHAYANPVHERLVADYCARHHPGLAVCLSSDVLPQYREYERVSSTVLNAAVMPILDRYLGEMERRLQAAGFSAPLHVMQGMGGVMGSAAARRRSVHTAVSGPVGGVLGGAFIARHAGQRDVVTLDMGGTSTDVSLVRAGEPEITAGGSLGGYPLSIPMIGLNYIGAGGGSIAWLDPGGILRVGPRSAGAVPGPVCYGRGGNQPTVTDANLVLGRLNPDNFLGGAIALDLAAARGSIAELGRTMGLDPLPVALGIVRVANANMIKAIRVISVDKGHDLRDFSLIAFGGAGPLHAGRLALELNIPRVIVPPQPGVLSALGLLVADAKTDYVETVLRAAGQVDPGELEAGFVRLERQAREWLTEQGIGAAGQSTVRAFDMRYRGQGHEVTVPVNGQRLGSDALHGAVADFHRLHQRLYTHAAPEEPTEIVNLRVLGVGEIVKPRLPVEAAQSLRDIEDHAKECAGIGRWSAFPDQAAALDEAAERALTRLPGRTTRDLLFEGKEKFERCTVFRRADLRCGMRLPGPAVVEQDDTTTIIYPGQGGAVDRFGNLVITPGHGGAAGATEGPAEGPTGGSSGGSLDG